MQQQANGIEFAPSSPQAPPDPLLTLPPVVQQPDLQGGGNAPHVRGRIVGSRQQLTDILMEADNALQAAAMAQHQASLAL